VKIDIDTSLIHASLVGHEHLFDELFSWLKGKELSVRQSKDLLEDAGVILDSAWRTESFKTKL